MVGITWHLPLKSPILLLQTSPTGYCGNTANAQPCAWSFLASQPLLGLSFVPIHESNGNSKYLPTLYLWSSNEIWTVESISAWKKPHKSCFLWLITKLDLQLHTAKPSQSNGIEFISSHYKVLIKSTREHFLILLIFTSIKYLAI